MNDGEFAWECLKMIGSRRLDCLIIGRQAMALYGCPCATQDVDGLVATPDMAAGLVKLAEDFGLELIHEETGRSLLDWLKGEPAKTLRIYADQPENMGNNPANYRRLDILICPSLGAPYAEAKSRSIPVELEPGSTIRIPHVNDLIAMKRLAGRPKDREDVAWLRQHRDAILHHFSAR